MRRSGEYRILGLVLVGMPLGLYGLLFHPSIHRLERLERRIRLAHEEAPDHASFTPVAAEERAFLEAPGAPWRTALPLIAEDGARISHVNRVVNALNAALIDRGLRATAIRAALDPVRIDFSLPSHLAWEAPASAGPRDVPENNVAAWVLEVEIPGTSRELFRALSALAGAQVPLEPVGIRWEASPGARLPGAAGARQCILVRNFYLKP